MKKMFLIAALLASGVAGAQPLRLTLEKAVEIALSENPTIKVADLEVKRIDYVRKEAVGNHLPSLSLGGQYERSLIKQEMSKGMSFGADNTVSGALDLQVPLFVPAVYASLKMTRTQQTLAVEQARASKIDMRNAVTKSFYQILLLEKTLMVLKESEATIKTVVDNTNEMYKAGLASEYDYLTASVQLSNLQPNLISTANGIAVAKQGLRMYLSLPENVEIELEGSLDGTTMPEILEPEAVLDGNSEMRQLEMQQELVKGQIRLANAARMPTIAGYGSLSVSGNDQKAIDFSSMMGNLSSLYTNPVTIANNLANYYHSDKPIPSDVLLNGVTFPSTDPKPQSNKWWWQTPMAVGVRMSIPLFAGFTNVNKVKQLRNQVSQLELQKDYLRQAKRLEARTAVNNLITAREKMMANERTVAQAEKAYSIARTRFDAGAGTMLEVNQAQLNVTQSRLNHTQAIYDLLAARADYDKVIGKGN